jgi:hypothetical protein
LSLTLMLACSACAPVKRASTSHEGGTGQFAGLVAHALPAAGFAFLALDEAASVRRDLIGWRWSTSRGSACSFGDIYFVAVDAEIAHGCSAPAARVAGTPSRRRALAFSRGAGHTVGPYGAYATGAAPKAACPPGKRLSPQRSNNGGATAGRPVAHLVGGAACSSLHQRFRNVPPSLVLQREGTSPPIALFAKLTVRGDLRDGPMDGRSGARHHRPPIPAREP